MRYEKSLKPFLKVALFFNKPPQSGIPLSTEFEIQ